MKYILLFLLTWLSFDKKSDDNTDTVSENGSDSNSDENGNKPKEKKEYCIYLFGRTKSGKSVCVEITNFNPFFYVSIPDFWTPSDCKRFWKDLQSSLFFVEHDFITYKIVKKKNAFGYHMDREFKFITLYFKTESTMRYAMSHINKCTTKPLKKYNSQRSLRGFLKVFNGNLDPMLAFMHMRNIYSCGWIKIHFNGLDFSKEKYKNGYFLSTSFMNCSIDKETEKEKMNIPPIKILSFDIECFSLSGNFPNPENENDYITQIGNTICLFDNYTTLSSEYQWAKSVFVLGDCDPVKDVKIEKFQKEKDLLLSWAKFLMDTDPDIIIGYNIDGFDWAYIRDRLKFLKCEISFCALITRIPNRPSRFYEKELQSKMSFGRKRHYLDIPGITQIDLYHKMRERSYDKYTLDYVSEKLLGEKKRDVHPKQIMKMSNPNPEEASAKDRAVIADYCAQDTALPMKLLIQEKILLNLMQMAKCSNVPLPWLLTRGQQIKVFSSFMRKLYHENYVFPKNLPSDNNVGYEGASVLECKRGFHGPTSGLDFASLYPSIIISYNLCLTTILLDNKIDQNQGLQITDENSNTFEWEYKTQHHKYTYIDQSVKRGIIPLLLDEYWKLRKMIKKQMKTAENSQLYDIYNGEQLAIKQLMNSFYGCLGAKNGAMALNDIAATVTYIGRSLIRFCQTYVEEKYDGSDSVEGVRGEVLYGDSVPGYMPITICVKNEFILSRTIENLHSTKYQKIRRISSGHSVYIDSEKEEAMAPKNTKVYTSKGWRPIKRIIRHACASKDIFRIVTERGIVEASSDHSMVLSDYSICKPSELEVGQSLAAPFITQRAKTRP